MKELIADILGLVRIFHFTKDETFDKETTTQNISTAVNNLSNSVDSKLSGKSNVDHKHIKQDVTDLSNASANVDGLLTKEDFTKLQGIEPGANKIIIDNTLNANSHNPVENAEIVDKIYDKNAIHALMANIDVGHGKLLSINVTEDGVLQVDNDSFEYYTTDEVDAELAKKTVSFEKQNIPDSGFFATYVLKQNNVQVGPKMNIPRDWLPISGSVKTCTTQDTPVTGYVVGDKYLDIVLNTKDGSGTDNHLYILATDFIDDYGADNVTLQLVNRQFSIKDKGVSKAKLSDSVQTSLGYADTFNSSPCKDITSNNISNWNSKAEISDIPTKVSELTNDSGYLSSHQDISMKVDKVTGKGLSTEDYTSAEKTKLSSIETGANKTTVDSSLSASSTNPVQNKVVNSALGNKVDKVSGKGLSTEDYTSAEKTKLSGIQAEANKTTVDSSMSGSSTNPVQNKIVKDYVDGLVGDIVSGDVDLSSTHNHDDRYFTESEITTKLSEKANSNHTHSKSNITDFPSSMTPTSHTDSNGAFGKATTSVWGHTKLSSATNSTDETTAATPKAVKTAYDLANGKSTVSFSPAKTSGTEIGTLTIDGTATKLYQQDDNTTYSPATQSANGLMSSGDKTKLDGIATGATKTVLNNTVTSTSTTEAATANAVKTAYDKGNHSHPYAASGHNHTTHNTQNISSGADLNTITTAGWYSNNSNSDVQKMSNTPWQATAPSSGGVGQAFAMEVLYTYGCIQILYPYNSNDIWVRRNNSNALGANNWTGWTKVFNNANLTKADITALGIPGTDTNTTYSADNSSLQVSSNQFSVKSGGITSSHIADGTIVNGDIANATIQGGKLVNGTITAAQLASNSVESAKIKDGNVTNAKLNDLSNLVTEYIVGTHGTTATPTWTGKSTKINSLQAGQVIFFKMTSAGTSAGNTLNLTLADGTTTTGAKNIYYNASARLTTHFPQNTILCMVYDGTSWICTAIQNTNNFDRISAYGQVVNGESSQIVANTFICGKSDKKYYKLANGVVFDIRYPIVLLAGALNSGANTSNVYGIKPDVNLQTTVSGKTVTNLQEVYVEGTAFSNGQFTVSSNVFVSDDSLTSGRYYIPIGQAYSTTNIRFVTSNKVFYYNGTNLIPVEDVKYNNYTHPNSGVTAGTNYNGNQTPSFGGTFNIPKLTFNAQGHITASANSTVTVPSLPTASTSTAGILKIGTTANDACAGNDSRLSNARTPTSHAHGNISNEGVISGATSKNVVTDANGKITTENKPTIPTGSSTATDIKMNGTQSAGASSNFAKADHVHPTDTSRAASSHAHGNISNNGAIGSTANLPIITGSNGVLQASSFGTAANTFCQGNDSRLSNTRTPTDNTVTTAKIVDDNVTTAKIADSAITSAKIADGTIVNEDIASNAAIAVSKISGLATVATSGSYNDLSNKPTIPTIGTGANNAAAGNHSHTRTLVKSYGSDGDARRIWLYANPAIRMCSLYCKDVVSSLSANATLTVGASSWIPSDYRPNIVSFGSGSFNSIVMINTDGGVVIRNGSQALASKEVWAQANWMY